MPRRKPGWRKARTCSSVRPAPSPRRIERADRGRGHSPAGTTAGVHPRLHARTGYVLRVCGQPDCRSTVSLGSEPPTDPGSNGHGVAASATVTGGTGSIVDVGVEGSCVTRPVPPTALATE